MWGNRNIKLVAIERRRNYLVSEPDFHSTAFFTEKVISNRNEKKIEILINKPVCLGLSVLEISKILMHEFWYDYVKQNYEETTKLCYIDTESFIVYIKTDNMCKDIAEDVETRFDTSNCKLDRLLPKRKL